MPFWSVSTIKEALGKIRATWKAHAEQMSHEQFLDLLRKESIIWIELQRRIKKAGIVKREMFDRSEYVVNGAVEHSLPFAKQWRPRSSP